MSIKIKYKKIKKSNKKKHKYTNTLILRKLFGFQNKYIIVLNNFLKRVKHLTCHLNKFFCQHKVLLENTSHN